MKNKIPNIHFFGSDAKFAHVGLVVESHDELLSYEQTTDVIQDVQVGFVNLNGVEIEFIKPISYNSPVFNNLLENRRLVHLAFYVDSIENALEKCKEYGFRKITQPQKAAAYSGNRIVFVAHKKYGIFELIEVNGLKF